MRQLAIDTLHFMPHDGMNVFMEPTMLKEVGASGQISLGKKYAGQLFDLQTADDGSLKLTPVKVVPVVQETQAEYRVAQPSQQTNREWAQTHAADIAQYNAWASQNEPYSQRVRKWRES